MRRPVLKFKLFVILCLCIPLGGYAQTGGKLDLSFKEKTVREFFQTIESQTEFTFMYNNIDLDQTVSVDVKQTSLDDILKAALTPLSLTYEVRNRQILIKEMQAPQADNQPAKTITGTVTDERGDPLIGANVMEKGTINGMTTDMDGNFTLSVKPGAVIQISYVGYVTREERIGNRNRITVSLKEDAQNLNEIVVVGYGTMRKSDLTGASSSVKSDVLLQRTVTSVNQALSGKAAGVNIAVNSGRPGGRTTVRIRGASSINVTNEPLYVVDGVILNVSSLENGSSPIDYVNPNDIRSVEVLKDASATAIYGARGANGVVMITTQRGEGVSGVSVRYNTDFGVGILPRKLGVLNAEEFLRNEELAYANAAKFDPIGWTAGNYKDPRLKRTDPRLFNAKGEPLYDTDWQDEAIRDAFSQTHQVSVANAKGNDSYGLSAGYRSEDGLIVESWMKRYSGRFFMDSQLYRWLKTGGSLNYNYQQEKQTDAMGDGGITVGRQIVEALPVLPLKYEDGSWAGNADYPGMEGGNNPVHVATDNDRTIETQSVIGNLYANITFMEGLELRSVLGANIINQKAKYYGGKQLVWISAPNGSASITNNRNNSWQFENYLTYNKTFSRAHRFTGMAGLSWQHVDNAWSSASGSGFEDDFFSYNNLGVATTQRSASTVNAYGLNSYFARVNYNLKERYLLTATARMDGSSKFGSSNRYAFFPSVGLAWRMSEESFIKSLPFVSNLKPRLSYGVTGNSETGPYASQGGLQSYTVVFSGAQASGTGVRALANPELKWEKTAQLNGGLDVGLLGGRISMEIDAYYKKTTDMLLAAPVPASSGYTTITRNIGSMENKGFEFAVGTVNIATTDFTWETAFNLSFNRNKVLELGEGNDDIYPGPDILSASNNIIRVGEPVGSFYGYKRLGTWGTAEETEAARYGKRPGDLKLWDKNNDGEINDADRLIIGKGIPDGYGTMSNSFRYKNLDFLAELQYMFGNDILDISKHSAEDRTGIANSYRTVLDAWTPENQNTMIAQIRPTGAGYTTNIDSHFVEDGSFLRGRNLSVGYTFPQSLTERIRLKNLRVYGSVQNFFVLSRYNGYDPEVSDASQSFSQGITVFGYPKPCTFTVGLNVNF
ncbi:MAG: TonB-dependent receptor [Tannerellaceae bacterium]|nr:TonB-dependent receptor [Tannerellaceae bacterium]